MKLIIVSVVNLAAVVAGGAGGAFIRPASPMPPAEVSDMALAEDGAEVGEAAQEAEAVAEEEIVIPDGYYSLRFSRPFVVPVTDGWRTQSLVVLNINILINQDMADGVTGLEERMRDKAMTALITLSHQSAFGGDISDPALYEQVRQSVRNRIETDFPGLVGDILILDMLKRDV